MAAVRVTRPGGGNPPPDEGRASSASSALVELGSEMAAERVSILQDHRRAPRAPAPPVRARRPPAARALGSGIRQRCHHLRDLEPVRHRRQPEPASRRRELGGDVTRPGQIVRDRGNPVTASTRHARGARRRSELERQARERYGPAAISHRSRPSMIRMRAERSL